MSRREEPAVVLGRELRSQKQNLDERREYHEEDAQIIPCPPPKLQSIPVTFHPSKSFPISKMSAGVIANTGSEKAPPTPTDTTDAAAAEPQYADQSTRLLPSSKIVIVCNNN